MYVPVLPDWPMQQKRQALSRFYAVGRLAFHVPITPQHRMDSLNQPSVSFADKLVYNNTIHKRAMGRISSRWQLTYAGNLYVRSTRTASICSTLLHRPLDRPHGLSVTGTLNMAIEPGQQQGDPGKLDIVLVRDERLRAGVTA